jgi:iron complex outermembrane receptor protein
LVPDVLAAASRRRIDDRDGRFDNLFTGEKSNAVRDRCRARAIPARARAGVRGAAQPPLSRLQTDGTYWTTASYAASGVVRNGYAPSTDKDEISTNAGEFSRNTQFGGSLHLDWDVGRPLADVDHRL